MMQIDNVRIEQQFQNQTALPIKKSKKKQIEEDSWIHLQLFPIWQVPANTMFGDTELRTRVNINCSSTDNNQIKNQLEKAFPIRTRQSQQQLQKRRLIGSYTNRNSFLLNATEYYMVVIQSKSYNSCRLFHPLFWKKIFLNMEISFPQKKTLGPTSTNRTIKEKQTIY